MRRNALSWTIPTFLLISAMLIMIDQVVRYRVVWDWADVLHHENFTLILISVALGMLLSQMSPMKRRKPEPQQNTSKHESQRKASNI